MHIIQCSICRRAAAWVIDDEVFCEGHKEGVIEASASITFLSADFASATRSSAQVAASRGDTRRTRRSEAVMPRRSELPWRKSLRRIAQPHVEYPARAGGILRQLQHHFQLGPPKCAVCGCRRFSIMTPSLQQLSGGFSNLHAVTCPA